MSSNTMRRIPELDGIRGIAILMVVVGHYFIGTVHAIPGTLLSYATRLFSVVSVSGVDLFFVLSGFLIGGILLDNRDALNYFSSFYIRRACRIFPIYYLWIALFFTLTMLPVSSVTLLGNNLQIWSYLVYFQNVMMIVKPNNGLGSIWLGLTWSLAIEEQFYLTAPILIRKFSQAYLVKILLFFLGLGIVFRWQLLYHPQGEFFSYVFTFTRLDGLILGVFSALIFRSGAGLHFVESNKRLLLLSICSVPLGVAVQIFHALRYLSCLAFLLLAIGYAAFLLTSVVHSSSFCSWMTRASFLRHIGLLAYGLYIYHTGINGLLHLVILRQDPVLRSWKDMAVTALSLIVAYVVARFSWTLIERPMIGLGHRIEYQKAVQKG